MTPDERWMRRALDLAERGAGAVSPNPKVGCVIVGPDGDVIGEGWHGAFGGPHAEVWALRDAERKHDPDIFRQSTLYVTLEPCSHHGKTPPCADLVLEKLDTFLKPDGALIDIKSVYRASQVPEGVRYWSL